MTDKPKRRWYQFSLKGMLVAMTLASLLLAWLAYERNEVQKRKLAIAAIEELGGRAEFDKAIPFRPIWLRPLLGDNSDGEVVRVFFYGRQIPDADLACLSGLSKLKTLNLNGSQMTDAGLAHLSGLSELEELELQRTQVTDDGLMRLASFLRLQELWLGEQVTDAGLDHLKTLTKLEHLDLKGDPLTDAGLVHLAGLKELKTLWLRRTRVTDQGVKDLRKALPNVQVERIDQ